MRPMRNSKGFCINDSNRLKFILFNLILLSALLFTGIKSAFAQEATKPSVPAVSLGKAEIHIDGVLNETIWQSQKSAKQFIQQEPHVGLAALARSSVFVTYDDKHLYIAAVLDDPEPGRVQADERQEDGQFDRSDAFAILIDSYHDHQNAFFFETNLLSAMSDALVSQEGAQVNRDWDAIWQVAAKPTATGWSVEFKIPFESIRFKTGDSQRWGIQFRRRVPHLKEISFWSPLTTEQDFFEVSRSGHLSGISVVEQKRALSLTPYTKAFYHKDQTGRKDLSESDFDGGIDLRYQLQTNLSLDLTVNTDFAETEVDRLQVNLTRFRLFFPEKRAFFLEGKGFYNFGLSGRVQPFFSRRIGLLSGQAVPILLGGKLSGKVGPYGIGTLLMQTEAENGQAAEQFAVVRLSRDVGLRSKLGLIATERRERNGASGDSTFGIDGTLAPNEHLSSEGFLVYTEGNQNSLRGRAAFAEINWQDPKWRIKLNHLQVTPDFSPELGFVRQSDLHETVGYLDIRLQPVKGWVREFGFKTEETYQTDDSGNFLYQSNYNRIQVDARSGDFLLLSVDPQRERLQEDFEIRSGIIIPTGTYTYTHYNIIFMSDERRPLSTVANLLWGGFYEGRKTSFDLTLTAAPAEGFKIGAGWEMNQVKLPQGDFTTQILDADLSWSVTNQLLLQGLIQWDKEDDTLAANLRLSWEYRESSWFYLIINPNHEKDGENYLILSKLTFRFEP